MELVQHPKNEFIGVPDTKIQDATISSDKSLLVLPSPCSRFLRQL